MTTQPRYQTKHVIQGEFFVTDDPTIVLSTLLGSCIAACFRDPVRGIGGMNHFLLPGKDPSASTNVRYGAHSMEQLINALLQKGARRNNLEVWLIGGANVLSGMTQIGDANARFSRQFVHDERFLLRGEDLGGSRGRKVRFHPASGRIDVAPLAETVLERPSPRPVRTAGDIELF